MVKKKSNRLVNQSFQQGYASPDTQLIPVSKLFISAEKRLLSEELSGPPQM
jgi:hypothetical protein